MAFTEAQRVKVRMYLGWSARFWQMDSRLEQAMNAVDDKADTVSYCQGLLTSLEEVDTAITGCYTRLKALKVGAIELSGHGEMAALRSEVAGLRVSDVNFVKGGRAVLRIRAAKTGRDQSAQVRHPQVILALRALVYSRLLEVGREVSLFDLPSGRVYARAFKRWVQALGPGLRVPFVPHSLRHGGATRDFLAGVEVARIQQYGRWRDPRSAMHYIQNCPALLQLQHIPGAMLAKGASFWPRMGAIFSDFLGFPGR